ncbi:MAG TPA: hypothetical protein VGQ37_16855 [Vicinamibacterales bacterium]|nr:hypothetical protein [Vicinamibacterales bacterium]
MTPSVRAAAWVGLAALVAGCTTSAKGLARDERRDNRRLQFSGAGVRTLDVRTLSGSIRVTGDNGSDVRVEAVTRVEADDDAGLKAGLQAVKFDAEEKGSTVAITLRDDGENTCGEQEWHRGPAWWDRRRYSSATELTIQAPRDVRVRLCTVNGDTVTVTNVTGDFDVSNVNGKVALSGMGGSGSATTVNGGIAASFAASPRGESRFKTVNGTIEATFPRDFAADLQLKTFNGGLFTDFDTQTLPVEPERAERAGRPRYVYRQRGFTKVRVGAGGPLLTFDTLNGDVRILRAVR